MARQLLKDLPATFVEGFHTASAVSRMQYRALGKSARLISALSLGASSFGGAFGDMTDDTCKAMVHTALRAGVNMYVVRRA